VPVKKWHTLEEERCESAAVVYALLTFFYFFATRATRWPALDITSPLAAAPLLPGDQALSHRRPPRLWSMPKRDKAAKKAAAAVALAAAAALPASLPSTSQPAASHAIIDRYEGVDKSSAGFKLLQAMGWREGDGLVSRKKRNRGDGAAPPPRPCPDTRPRPRPAHLSPSSLSLSLSFFRVPASRESRPTSASPAARTPLASARRKRRGRPTTGRPGWPVTGACWQN
jgi:hypothetical protein